VGVIVVDAAGKVAAFNPAAEDIFGVRAGRAIGRALMSKPKLVLFDEPSLEAIRAYLKERADSYAPLFIRHDRARGIPRAGGANYRLSAQSVFVMVKEYGRAVGIDVSPHDFRHTKATTLLNAGAKLSEVQDLLGHASPETTKKIYACPLYTSPTPRDS